MNDNTDSPSVQIPLSNNLIAFVDEVDREVSVLNWRAIKPPHSRTHYLHRTVYPDGRKFTEQIHRVIMSRVLERELEANEYVDHKNQNGLDNRRANLRLATRTQNMGNRRLNSDNTSGYKGVSYYKKSGKWRAAIGMNGKLKHIGYFLTPELAAEAYNQAAIKQYGEFASLNVIPCETTE